MMDNAKKYRPCTKCEGTGWVECDYCFGSGEDDDGDPCSVCNGDGEVECPRCEGTGEIEENTSACVGGA